MKNTFFDPADSPTLYAIQGRGGCLEPLVPEGSITYISGAMKPEIGVGGNVVLYFAEGIFTEGGNIRHKLLVDMSAETVTIRQLNPLTTVTFRREAILAMHTVFAIQTPDGCIWDLRTMSGRLAFRQRQLAGRSIAGEL